MSNHLTSLAYKVDAGSLLRKAVLVMLADKASDDGSGIWASKQTMADELCCSKQALLNTLHDFIAEGILIEVGQRKNRNGYTVIYELNVAALEAMKKVKRWADDPSTALTGKRGGPVNSVGETSQPDGPKPPLTTQPPAEADASAPPGGGQQQLDLDPKAEKGRGKRGKRLPDDWQPPKVDQLPLTVQAVVKQWPDGAYDFVAAGFVAHWLSDGTAKAAKRDWDQAWIKWLVGEGPRVMEMKRKGISFRVETDGQSKLSEEARALMAMRPKEDAEALRNRLHRELGDHVYNGWLLPTFIKITDERITLTVPSLFVRDYILNNFVDTIGECEFHLSGKAKRVVIEVLR